jgi:endonuclease-3
MAKTDRSSQFNKLQKVLKKHYEPMLPLADRSVLEHLLFALCLENSHYEKAEEVFARLQLYDDWNEVRVTSQTELSEVMGALGDPPGSAARVKGALQSVFEHGLFDQKYEFNIDHLRKQNIGKAIKELEKFPSVTPFALAYVTQAALGGHSIPLDRGTLDVLRVLDLVSEKDYEKKHVPGLERAVPKNKGAEFGSLLHQFGADFYISPHATRVRNIVLEINPDAKDRLPKRSAKEPAAEVPKPASKSKGVKPDRAAKAQPKTDSKSASKAEPKAEPKKKGAKSGGEKTATKGLAKRKPR